MFACGSFTLSPGELFWIYATLGFWGVAGLAALVNLALVLKGPRERRFLELLLWLSLLGVAAGGWYPLLLLRKFQIIAWLSFIYGAPALVLGHSVRLFVLRRREAALGNSAEAPAEALPGEQVRFALD